MSYEETTVAAKLRDSLAAHQAAWDARRRKDLTTAIPELRRAYMLRMEAHHLDPEHTAPAWQEEDRRTPRGRNTHDEMMNFYRQQLDKETPDAVRESAAHIHPDEQPAAESATQPGESEPVTASPAITESEQPAADAQPEATTGTRSSATEHSATARVTAKRLQRKARHG